MPEAELLTRLEWITELARTLVFDRGEAEDVAQEAWIAASPQASAPWLRRVVRNLAVNRRRGDERRRAREARAARPERTAATVDLVGRAEMQRCVLDAVLRLRDAHREVILLRFWEGRPPREIARALGVPVETARTRLKRATGELRRALDRRFGDRSTWCLALLPLVAAGKRGGLIAMGGALAMKKSQALVLSIALIAALLSLLAGLVSLADSDPPSEPDPRAPVVRSDPDPPASLEVTPGGPSAGAGSASAEADARESAGPGRRIVRGRVIAVDVRGREHDDLSGSFRLHAWDGVTEDAFESLDVDVHGGRFETSAPLGLDLYPADLILDERRARPDEPVLVVKPEGSAVLRATLDPVRILRVFAENGPELRDLVIRSRSPWEGDRVGPAGGAKGDGVVASGVDSPYTISSQIRSFLWVGAPGHAWRSVGGVGSFQGERIVTLERGASLLVRPVGPRPNEPVFVRLYDWDVHAGMRLDGSEVRFDGLRPDAYTVAVEIGGRGSALRLGEARVRLEPGATEEVEIPYELPADDRARLTGEVVFPEPYDDGLRLTLERADSSAEELHLRSDEMERAAPRIVRFDAGNVPPGTWRARVSAGFFFEHVFEMAPSTPSHVRIEIPELAVGVVRVRNARTGALLLPDDVSVGTIDSAGFGTSSRRRVSRDPDTDEYRFRAPLGRVGVYASDQRFFGAGTTPELLPGRNEVTLELEPASTLRVAMIADGREVAVGEMWWQRVSIRSEDRRPYREGGALWRETELVQTLEAGRYRVSFPDLPGYEPIPDAEVTVGDRERAELLVPVERSR